MVDCPNGQWYCNGSVAIGDALKIARSVIGLAVNKTEPCPDLGHTSLISEPG